MIKILSKVIDFDLISDIFHIGMFFLIRWTIVLLVFFVLFTFAFEM